MWWKHSARLPSSFEECGHSVLPQIHKCYPIRNKRHISWHSALLFVLSSGQSQIHYTVDRSTPWADWTAKSTAKLTDVWLKHSPVFGGTLATVELELADTFLVPRSQFYSSFLMTDSGRVSQRLHSNTKYIYKILHLFCGHAILGLLLGDLSAAHCSKVLVRTLAGVPSISAAGDASWLYFPVASISSWTQRNDSEKSAWALVQYVQRTLFGDDQLAIEKKRFCKPE